MQSFQLIHDHYQRSPIWSSSSEATEGATDSLSSRQLAAMLQRQFDEEDHLLVEERAELLAAAEEQRVFDCGVCLDTLPEESIARFDPCGHSFCRECIRGFIVSQIESRRFPVLCPTCTAGPDNNHPESIGSYVSIICYSE
jgi:Ring finger domain